MTSGSSFPIFLFYMFQRCVLSEFAICVSARGILLILSTMMSMISTNLS